MADRKTKRTPRNHTGDEIRQSGKTGTYFLSLEVGNIKCFKKKQFLDLSDGNGRPARWTVLLGANGTGKTTLLQVLAGYSTMLQFKGGTAFSGDPAGRFMLFHLARMRESFRRQDPPNPLVEIKALEGLNLSCATNRTRPHVLNFERFFDAILSANEMLIPDTPLICYAYGAGRRSRPLRREPYDLDLEGVFPDQTELLSADEWLLQLDYSAAKPSPIQDSQQSKLQMLKALLTRVLPEVSRIRFTTPHEEVPSPTVEFETPYGWVPLHGLGYGYRTMIAWIVDFASRMVERYPESSDPLA
jgi:hypothetical protein